MTDNESITTPISDDATEQNNSGEQQQSNAPDGYLSQDEVNAIIGRTRKEASQRTLDKLLGDIGVDSTDKLVDRLKQLEKLEQDQMSEVEKALAKAERLERELEAERQKRSEIESAAERERRNRVISDALKTAGAQHPDDLIAIASNVGVSFDSVFDDEGQPVQKALDNVVGELKTQRPHAFKSTAPGSPSNRDGKPVSPARQNIEDIRKQVMKQKGRW